MTDDRDDRPRWPRPPRQVTSRAGLEAGLAELRREGPRPWHERDRWLQTLEKFERFLERNPDFWPLFERWTGRAIASGRPRFSSMLICQRVRWETETGDDRTLHGLKINNNFTPYCARLYVCLHPEFDGFFETRKQRTHGKAERKRDHYHVGADYDDDDNGDE